SDVRALALDPHATATVWAAGSSGVFRSDDGGASWIRADNGLPGRPVLGLVIDPEKPSTAYASYAGIEGGIFKTTDTGRNWARIRRSTGWSGSGFRLAISSAPSVLYALWGGYDGNLISKSSDGGATWTDVTFDYDFY